MQIIMLLFFFFPYHTPQTTMYHKKPNAKVTPFQNRVYDVVSTIPKGSVRTYGSIAKELNTAARAVGGAMGKNPFPSDQVP
mmetsp:Transcript_12301/g.24995  ORF Transcript_12301/g.24995 Transcript_12301/m.24995 type:complete len:81 (+) Transcript_12301:21-263(+)